MDVSELASAAAAAAATPESASPARGAAASASAGCGGCGCPMACCAKPRTSFTTLLKASPAWDTPAATRGWLSRAYARGACLFGCETPVRLLREGSWYVQERAQLCGRVGEATYSTIMTERYPTVDGGLSIRQGKITHHLVGASSLPLQLGWQSSVNGSDI